MPWSPASRHPTPSRCNLGGGSKSGTLSRNPTLGGPPWGGRGWLKGGGGGVVVTDLKIEWIGHRCPMVKSSGRHIGTQRYSDKAVAKKIEAQAVHQTCKRKQGYCRLFRYESQCGFRWLHCAPNLRLQRCAIHSILRSVGGGVGISFLRPWYPTAGLSQSTYSALRVSVTTPHQYAFATEKGSRTHQHGLG